MRENLFSHCPRGSLSLRKKDASNSNSFRPVANQIAAGEVVERPVAVVKELIENSIDAGASKIEVEFRNGGKSYLRVEDDGCGMNADEALLSLERHATSKIQKASDLHEVQTFGFRGEALPSISSVSRFTLRTRAKSNPDGNEIFINGGKMIHVKECGMPYGTRIEVSHLFNSVPGRRKFLKTEVTEAAHIIHISKLYALAHPSIAFSLIEGGRTLFRSPACEGFAERVRETLGKGLAECLAPIELEPGLSLEGLIGKPGQSRPTRKEMIFFVNRRPVESKTLSYAVLEAYHTYAPKGRYPPAILFLSLDPSQVDVNVHPAKREIRFRDERKVRQFLMDGILERNRQLAGQLDEVENEQEMERDASSGMLVPQIDPQALRLHQGKPRSSLGEGMGLAREPELPLGQNSEWQAGGIENQEGVEEAASSSVGFRHRVDVDWKFLDRPHGDMAIFSTPQEVVAVAGLPMNGSVSNNLRIRLKGRNSRTQTLLLPESLELDGMDTALLEKGREGLDKVGFRGRVWAEFLSHRGMPTWIDPSQAVGFLRDFLEVARENGGEMNTGSFAKEALIRQATQSQGAGEDFSDDEVVRMTNRLLACRNPYTCPRGRPTYFEIRREI